MRVMVAYDNDTGVIERAAMSATDHPIKMAAEAHTLDVPDPKSWWDQFCEDEDPIACIPSMCEMNEARDGIQLKA